MSSYSYEEVYTFLDNLRESGIVNMFAAGPYVKDAFNLSSSEARKLLTGWMKAYGKTWDGDKHQFVQDFHRLLGALTK